MSDLGDPRIRCPSCGKNAPAMKYCIYCGAGLPQTAPFAVRQPQPTLPPALPPTAVPPTQPSYVIGTKDEIVHLMADIVAFHERKVVLLGLFQSEQVSERVFRKIYDEYSGKLKEFLNVRLIRIKESKSKIDEKNIRLSEVAMKFEELEVRHKVAEIDTNLYDQEASKLRAEERELTDSMKTLGMNIESLKKMLANKKPEEIRDLETNMRSYGSSLEKLAEEGKVSSKTYEEIKPDIEETIGFFSSLIKERKEKEKELREHLETLQTRYKLSELSIEEYERKKRELQAAIDKIWS